MSVINAVVGKVLGCKLEVSHIVTVGCSWTYCQGLPDILNQGWPALIAKRFNIPLVNLAVPGIGNDSIHRKTYEYVYENLPTGSKPFVIIGWSQYWRREGWHNSFKNDKDYQDYRPIIFPDNKPTNSYQHAVLDYWNEEDFFRKTILYKLSLMNLLKNHNIPYLMGDMVCREASHDALTQKYSDICNRITNTLQNICEITHNYAKLPCGHESIEGNIAIADYVIKQIQNRFDNLTHVDMDYLHLRDYIKNSKTHQIHPEWCEFTL